MFQSIQTVDSAKLARRLDESGRPLDVMLEVKLSPEQAKTGAAPEELPDLIAAVRGCPHLRLLGLMTMPPWSDDPEQSRPYFRRLRELAGAARAAAAFHGHVARSGGGHRRGLHLGARGHGAVRQAQEAVTVGFYSPLPPARTGVADYAAALLAALRRHGTRGSRTRGMRTSRFITWATISCIARSTGARWSGPGVVVLHDAVLHHFFLGSLDRAATSKSSSTTTANGIAGWRKNCGAGAPVRASTSRYFDYPMLKRIAERSRAVVVHNPAAARMVREHAPGAAVVEIPHLFAPPRAAGRLGSDPHAPAAGRSGAARFCSACSDTCANRSGCSPCCARSRGCGGRVRTRGC